ncbi:MAG: divalent-cation tolerance protein CutA [Oligoflexia bacterium]|nr:divalent-cation tolerance protein CutA [Oligoflexia bacterium]MBF0366076.1 divalent-cation tolerance protein CutA [Oligoflexia bacterium]
MDYIMVYIPHPSKESALKSARYLVEKKLIACANIIDPILSIYTWEGKLEESSEVLVLAKTHKRHFELLKNEVSKIHPYTCPCITSIELSGANAAYLEWINQVIA